MKKLILSAAVVVALISCNKEKEGTATTSEKSGPVTSPENVSEEGKKASYAFGISLGQRAESATKEIGDLDASVVKSAAKEYLNSPQDFSSKAQGYEVGKNIENVMKNPIVGGNLDVDEILAGMNDYLAKKDLKVSPDSVGTIMTKFSQTQMKAVAEKNKEEGAAFMEKVKKEEGVKTTESGLAYKVLKEGEGGSPAMGDKVTVKYTGTKLDGEVFDSTDKSGGEPIEFNLKAGALIPGWIEAMPLMKKGGKYELYIPSELAYGERGSQPKIGQNETLKFEIELIDFAQGTPPQSSAAGGANPGVKIQAQPKK